MAVHVRLRRIGKNPKGQIHFRISVFEKTRNRDGRSIEDIGFYTPKSGQTKIDKERYEYWIKNGAQATETVKNIFKKENKPVKK